MSDFPSCLQASSRSRTVPPRVEVAGLGSRVCGNPLPGFGHFLDIGGISVIRQSTSANNGMRAATIGPASPSTKSPRRSSCDASGPGRFAQPFRTVKTSDFCHVWWRSPAAWPRCRWRRTVFRAAGYAGDRGHRWTIRVRVRHARRSVVGADALASVTLSGPGGSVTLDGNTEQPMAILRDHPRERSEEGLQTASRNAVAGAMEASAGNAGGTVVGPGRINNRERRNRRPGSGERRHTVPTAGSTPRRNSERRSRCTVLSW